MDAPMPDRLHNQPPAEEQLKGELAERYADLVSEKERLVTEAANAPEIVEDDAALAAVGDIVKDIMKATKAALAYHAQEKEPFLTGGRVVDSWFRALVGDKNNPRGMPGTFLALKTTLEARQKKYLDAKAERERRQRAEEAAAARAEAERRARIAAEAQAEADERARAAEAARAKATTPLREAKADLTAGHAAIAESVATVAVQESALAAGEAAKAAQAVEAKPADLARTRTSTGVTTLAERWVGDLADRAALDLETLRPHLSDKCLGQAISAFVQAGGRTLEGAAIYPTTKVSNR